MKEQFLRLGLLALVATATVACDDDAEAPQGETSTVNVAVFVDTNGNQTFDAGVDDAIAAEVLLESNESDATYTAQTSGGVATFTDVPAGSYTLSHTATTVPSGAVLAGATEQTIVAQFEGGTTDAAVRYVYNPGAIEGTVYRDEDASGDYDPAADTTMAGFQVILVSGADTAAANARVDSVTVGDDGEFLFDDIARGDYTLLVRPILGATLPAGPTYPVTVIAGDTVEVDIAFEGGATVSDVADARGLPLGTQVTLELIVTAGTDVYNATTAYAQDSTGGIVIDQFGAATITPLTRGDSIQVTGTLDVFNQELRVENVTIDFLDNVDVPAPQTATVAEINGGMFQGELVVLNGVTVDSVDAGFNTEVWVSDGTGDLLVYLDGTTGLDDTFISVGGTYNITGVAADFSGLFQVKPRAAEDLELTSPPAGTIPVALARIASLGSTVTVEAVVTAGTGDFSSTTAYAQDGTAGIVIDQFGAGSVTPLAVGDSVRVSGTVDVFNDEVRIENVTITNLGTGTVTPRAISAADLAGEKFLAELVTIDDLEVTNVGTASSSGFSVTATDGSASITVRVDTDTGLTTADFTVGTVYDITGVAAYFFGPQLQPRGAADVVAQ